MPSFSITYGSLGGIIVTLFFFYISAVLFIFGAELNSVLRRRNENRLQAERAPWAFRAPAGAPRMRAGRPARSRSLPMMTDPCRSCRARRA